MHQVGNEAKQIHVAIGGWKQRAAGKRYTHEGSSHFYWTRWLQVDHLDAIMAAL